MCEHTGGPTTKDYTVGPGKEFTSIGAVPWELLNAGDTVRIFHRDDPYAERIYLVRSGKPNEPIRVCGVANEEGKLPTITGNGASTRQQLAATVNLSAGDISAQLGVVTIISPDFDEQVSHVRVEGLKITGTLVGDNTDDRNGFRDSKDKPFDWVERSACVWVKRAAHIEIRGNEIYNCGYGVFAASTAENDTHIIRDLRVDGNYFHDNGLRDNDQRHQTYLQGVDVTVQYNYFGPTRHGDAGGNHLKTRVAGLIARYNYFDNAPNAHLIDIVEVEEYRSYIMPWRHRERVEILRANGMTQEQADAADALQASDWAKYQNAYVYGNLIHLHGSGAPSGPIHYGFDNTALDRQPGKLWFYNNTFLYEANSGSASLVYYGTDSGDGDKYGPYTMDMLNFDLDLPSDPDTLPDELHYISTNAHDFMDGDGDDDAQICEAVSATCKDRGKMLPNKQADYGKIIAYNNAIVVLPITGTQKATLRLTRYLWDMLELNGGNWINTTAQPGDRPIEPQSIVWPGGNAQHHVTGANTLIQGAANASPIVRGTFEPLSGSELLDKAVALPAELQTLLPEFQVVRDPAKPGKLTITPRATLKTIGAIETASSSTEPGPGAAN